MYNLPLWALLTQCGTTTAHIADLGLLARGSSAAGALDTSLPLVGVVQTDKFHVLLHGLGNPVPECRVQRRILVPPCCRSVCISGGVFDLKGRTCVLQSRVVRHIAVEGVCFVNVEVARVDLIQTEATVQVLQRGYAGHDPTGGEGIVGILHSPVVGIVNHELVLVGVSEEDVGNNMGRVAVHDLVE